MLRCRFRPRYRALALSSLGLGGALAAVSLVVLGGALLPLATGAIGAVLGSGYLLSPTWKLEVIADDTGLEVRSVKGSRFRLAWSDVVHVVAAPAMHTCFIDGGKPEHSLLVPGVGAPAPYDLEHKAELVAAVLAHVAADKIERVASLEGYSRGTR